MKHIYCISGLGADERVFSSFQFQQHEIHYIKWVSPGKNESIASYAKKLTSQVYHVNPILLGLSFGGIVCIEIARLIEVEFIIIISSIKTNDEMPMWMQVTGKLKLNRIFPMRSFAWMRPIENYNMGASSTEEKQMLNDYRDRMDTTYSNWAINAILNWKNKKVPANLYHLHGDADRIFSIKKIKPNYTIRNGGHLMILQKSAEVNECINAILQKHLAATADNEARQAS